MSFDRIPEKLREHSQWVGWRGKVPITPGTTRNASPTNPSTWRSFDAAVEAAQAGQADGIGFVFAEDDPFVGIDLDGVVTADGIHPAAVKILERLASYAEYSPSGTGIHVIARGKVPGSRHRTDNTPWGDEFEIYDSGRYFRMTGRQVENTPATVEACQSAIDKICERMFPPNAPPAPAVSSPGSMGRDEFAALWRGDRTRYAGDASRADLALCSHLAKLTHDPETVDRMFRQSGLMRPKWDQRRGEHTYGQMTVEHVLRGAAPRFATRPADASKMRPAEFVWWPFLVRGALNLMVGEEKIGKSTFSVWIAAALSRGTLPGQFKGEPKDVLFIGADEDDWESVTLPRLHAAGADFSHIHEFIDLDGDLFNVADHSKALSDLLSHCPSPLRGGTVGQPNWGLIICEHLMDVLPPMKNYTDPAALRRATKPFRRALRASGVAGLGSLHVNKAEAQTFRQRGQGSVQWSAMARSAFLVDRHPKDRNRRIAILGAANNVRDDEPQSVAFAIEPAKFEHESRSYDVGKVTGVVADGTSMAEVLAGGESGRTRIARERRAAVLNVLTEAPQTVREVEKATKIPRSTVQRILEDLEDGGEARKVDGGWIVAGDRDEEQEAEA